ncbi:MAG: RNA methyltransferase [Oscillospiraceae bacterium]|jgi:TrmH family RNA methyltransferase|nr:RNA methyltransferase [Oscillospiraceae bacterium]
MKKIESAANPLVKNTAKLCKSAKERQNSRLFVAEGLRLCRDAFFTLQASGQLAKIKYAVFTQEFCTDNAEFVMAVEAAVCECYLMDERLFKKAADTNSPQGVLFAIEWLDNNFSFDTIKSNPNGKYILLDSIADPSNMGTIFRSANAFGASGVVLSGNCCDVYSPKVLRGSMGAVLRLPFCTVEDTTQFLTNFNTCGESYAAVLNAEAQSLNNCSFNKTSLIAIGNEANGLSESVIANCTHSVYIPMGGNCESLNAAVAASIFLYVLGKQ